MEIAARAARFGNRILSFVAAMMILLLFAYGGYSLWDSYMISRGAFLGNDLLRYKPTGGGEGGENLSLEELVTLNPDICGWLTIEDTHIDYPVVQGENDMEYVNKDVLGEFSLSGSIFLSCMNRSDFTDAYNLLYGHHMDSGGMFGDVVKFLNPDYFSEHTTGRLYLPDETDEIALFACVETDAYDQKIYSTGKYCDDVSELLEVLRSEADQYREIPWESDDRVVALSTCMDVVTNGRVILFGQLRKMETPDDSDGW